MEDEKAKHRPIPFGLQCIIIFFILVGLLGILGVPVAGLIIAFLKKRKKKSSTPNKANV